MYYCNRSRAPSAPIFGEFRQPSAVSQATRNAQNWCVVECSSEAECVALQQQNSEILKTVVKQQSTAAATATMAEDAIVESEELREQDRFLPIANISRIMKKSLPDNAKIAKDAKETVQVHTCVWFPHPFPPRPWLACSRYTITPNSLCICPLSVRQDVDTIYSSSEDFLAVLHA